jgi:hypothetical protein
MAAVSLSLSGCLDAGVDETDSIEQAYTRVSDGKNITCTTSLSRGNDNVQMAGVFVGPIRDGLGGTIALSVVSGDTTSALGSYVNANGVPAMTLNYRTNRTTFLFHFGTVRASGTVNIDWAAGKSFNSFDTGFASGRVTLQNGLVAFVNLTCRPNRR